MLAASLGLRLPRPSWSIGSNSTLAGAEDNTTLPLEAWVSVQVHSILQSLPITGELVAEAVAGTPVAITIGSRAMAIGIILAPTGGRFEAAQGSGEAKVKKVTATRAIVQVTKVIAPAAYLVHHDQTFESFGRTPFPVLVNLATLRTHPTSQATIPSHSIPSQSLSPAINTLPLVPPQIDVPHPPSAPQDADTDSSDEYAEVEPDTDGEVESAEDLSSRIHDPPCHQPASSSVLDTRVLDDPFHFMDRVLRTIPETHSLRKAFSVAFSDTLFTIDQDDKLLVSATLEHRKPNPTTFHDVRHRNPSWLWDRVRRYIPGKEYLHTALTELFHEWGPCKCSRTGLSLFNKDSWKKANALLEDTQRGWISDPPAISLYVKMSTDREGLAVYRCLRGTNSVEGGVHMLLMRIFGSLNASPELADAILADWRYRHNEDVRDFPPPCTAAHFL